ncbi:hypothetical protein [Niastella sp. OAS944]|uniref:hypothetical protein n=1 Tax=Niastella sp. OAS944 TaxID=2664089 RepID=UPI0034813094|nr:hypothetical protein [Chitinophagaceae bacterium OAS944]
MKAKALLFLLTILCMATSFAQTFEGKITYKNKYKSKMPNVTDAQLTSMMGGKYEYYIKNGNYKSTTNGLMLQWQLYVNKENKLYNKMASTETLTWYDGAVNKDSILKLELNEGVTEILGYKCDELIFTCVSGVQKYYFSKKIAVDPKLFANHKFMNWYEYISRSNALPLKAIVDNAQFTWESIASDVQEVKLEESFFALPAGVATTQGAL